MEQLSISERHKKAETIFRRAYLSSKKREESLVIGETIKEGLIGDNFSFRVIKTTAFLDYYGVYIAERKKKNYIMRIDLNRIFKSMKNRVDPYLKQLERGEYL